MQGLDRSLWSLAADYADQADNLFGQLVPGRGPAWSELTWLNFCSNKCGNLPNLHRIMRSAKEKPDNLLFSVFLILFQHAFGKLTWAAEYEHCTSTCSEGKSFHRLQPV